jgi:hypothetical protein
LLKTSIPVPITVPPKSKYYPGAFENNSQTFLRPER